MNYLYRKNFRGFQLIIANLEQSALKYSIWSSFNSIYKFIICNIICQANFSSFISYSIYLSFKIILSKLLILSKYIQPLYNLCFVKKWSEVFTKNTKRDLFLLKQLSETPFRIDITWKEVLNKFINKNL